MPKRRSSDQLKGQALKKLLRWAELNAAELRSMAGLGETEPLDPRDRCNQLRVVIASEESLAELPEVSRSQLLQLGVKQWSGMASPLPDGRLFVLLNPQQTAERATVTIMEEVAHAHYEHIPVSFDDEGMRVYNQDQEFEAYQTAAAALLPMRVVSRSVWSGQRAEQIARRYGVSVELVEMRIKMLGLWEQYTK